MLLSLPFYKLCPGGNPTVLIHDNSLFASPASHRAAIANAVLDSDHLGADQVGFLDTSRDMPHMEMMGGEFCVNATLSATVVFAMLGLLPLSNDCRLTTSGVAGPVSVNAIERAPGVSYDASLTISLPETTGPLVRDLGPGETLVSLPGITHLLLDATHTLSENLFAAAAAKRKKHDLDTLEAAGVIWHCPCADDPGTHRITPVIHVAATGSSVMETACGSGSLALALFLAKGRESTHAIRQPSGCDITVALSGKTARISGAVQVTASGATYVRL